MDRALLAGLVGLLVLGLSGCAQKAIEERVWVELEPVQCQGNPWEPVGKEFSGEADALKAYYQARGVEIYDYQYVERTLNTCTACACPRGDKYRLLVDAKNRDAVFFWPKKATEKAGVFFEASVKPEKVDAGSEVLVQLRNNSMKPVYFGGCNDYAVESLVEGQWRELPKFVKQCGWEGLPKKAEGQNFLEWTENRVDIPGRHRLVFQLGLDCLEQRPLSEANCRIRIPLRSNEFTVNPLQEIPESQLRACSTSAECVKAVEGCCDCANGGRNTAINRKFLSPWLKKREAGCLTVMCPAVLSTDPSCSETHSPQCVEGTCQLTAKAVDVVAAARTRFKRLASGPFSRAGTEVEVHRGKESFQGLWENTYAQLAPKPDLPAVDFNASMVVGLYMQRITGSPYLVKVERVEETDTALIIWYSKRYATPVEIRNIVEFAPYELIEVPQSAKNVEMQVLSSASGKAPTPLRRKGVRQQGETHSRAHTR